jgi:hypothetical protein
VAADEFGSRDGGRRVYVIDDSSGVNLECTCTAPPQPAAAAVPADTESKTSGKVATTSIVPMKVEPQSTKSPDGPELKGIDVGSVVKVKGGIGSFRGARQIRMKSIVVLGDTNAEVKAWKEMVEFRVQILAQPWVVGKEQEDQCRAEAERELRWEEKKRKHKSGSGGDEVQERRDRQKAREKEREKERRMVLKKEEERQKAKKSKKKAGEGLGRDNMVNYPSQAVRQRATGKYDALGI